MLFSLIPAPTHILTLLSPSHLSTFISSALRARFPRTTTPSSPRKLQFPKTRAKHGTCKRYTFSTTPSPSHLHPLLSIKTKRNKYTTTRTCLHCGKKLKRERRHSIPVLSVSPGLETIDEGEVYQPPIPLSPVSQPSDFESAVPPVPDKMLESFRGREFPVGRSLVRERRVRFAPVLEVIEEVVEEEEEGWVYL